MKVRDWWLPEGISFEAVFEGSESVDIGDGITLEHARPTADGLRRLAGHLRVVREHALADLPIREIVEALDRLAALWLDPTLPERLNSIRAISSVTGFSSAMVEHAIDLEQKSSRAPDLLAALERDLGDPAVLDGFTPVPHLSGRAHAVGPGLIGAVFSANIPALPHLTVMRALLVKAACLGRVSQDEPVFLPLYCDTLRRVAPELARCVAVVHWPREALDIEAQFLSSIDHLIAYGGDAALSAIRQRAPRTLPASWHGHRVGLSIVLNSALKRDNVEILADKLAYDFTVFDQHACLAPQALYVEEGGEVRPDELADALARALVSWTHKLPPRRRSPQELARVRGLVADLEMRAVMGESVRLISDSAALDGVVVVEPASMPGPSPLDRFAKVMPIESWRALPELLDPARGLLQNAAVAGSGADAEAVRQLLARLGCSRICPPGLMGTPSMMWRHDGLPRLGELVRWCDEEVVPPGS